MAMATYRFPLPPCTVNLTTHTRVCRTRPSILRMHAGALVVTLIELVTTLFFTFLCFGGQMADWAAEADKAAVDPEYQPTYELQHGFGYFMYIVLMSYVTAGVVEECSKAALVRHACCGCDNDRSCCIQRPDPRPRNQAYTTIALILAASIGFSTTENLLYVFTVYSDENHSGLIGKLVLAVVRGAVSMPVHAICASFTGLRLSIRDVQRRTRDATTMSQLASTGVPQFVVLPSGMTVPVAMPQLQQQQQPAVQDWVQPAMSQASQQQQQGQEAPPLSQVMSGLYGPPPLTAGAGAVPGATMAALPPPATAVRGFGLASPAAAAGAAASAARRVLVWSWPRVMWPAIAVHGTFDMLVLAFGDPSIIPSLEGAITMVLLTGLTVLGASLWALVTQFKVAFDIVANGRIPQRVTCAPVWWPAWCKRCAERRGYGGLDNEDAYSYMAFPAGAGGDAAAQQPMLDQQQQQYTSGAGRGDGPGGGGGGEAIAVPVEGALSGDDIRLINSVAAQAVSSAPLVVGAQTLTDANGYPLPEPRLVQHQTMQQHQQYPQFQPHQPQQQNGTSGAAAGGHPGYNNPYAQPQYPQQGVNASAAMMGGPSQAYYPHHPQVQTAQQLQPNNAGPAPGAGALGAGDATAASAVYPAAGKQ